MTRKKRLMGLLNIWRHRKKIMLLMFLLMSQHALAADKNAEEDALGFSITGDKESPNVLYLVPWKTPPSPDKIAPPFPDLLPLELINPSSQRQEQQLFKQVQRLHNAP